MFALVLERDLHFRSIRLDFSILELQILLHDFCDPKIPQRFTSHIDRRLGSLLPRLCTSANQFNDVVNGIRHDSLLVSRATESNQSLSTSLHPDYDLLTRSLKPLLVTFTRN